MFVSMYHLVYIFGFIFFFKQKTAYEMRISDWSSDVCSSDLPIGCSDDIDSRIRAAAGPSGSMPAKRVGIPPGQTELTRMPCAATSSASARVRLTIAPLLAL